MMKCLLSITITLVAFYAELVMAKPKGTPSVAYRVGALTFDAVETPGQKDLLVPQIVPLFVKRNGGWERHESKDGTWTVILDGRAIGSASEKNFSSIGSKPVPTEFTTMIGTVKAKPFALVTGSDGKDPDKWKPWKLSNRDLKMVRESYLKLLVESQKTGSKEIESNEIDLKPLTSARFQCPGFSRLNGDKAKIKKLSCKEEDKIQIRKPYQRKSGASIVQVLIETDREGEFEGTTELINSWLVYRENSAAPKFLFSDNTLWDALLIEAADFDKDGKSELLFETSGYNSKEFYLFSSDFKVEAKTSESYH